MRLVKTFISQNTIINIVKTKKAQCTCLAGEKIAVLYSNGDVSACELLHSTIGNIKDYNYDFQQLWKAKQRKEIIHYIKKNKCFCTHECFITANLIFKASNLFRILSKIYLLPSIAKKPLP